MAENEREENLAQARAFARLHSSSPHGSSSASAEARIRTLESLLLRAKKVIKDQQEKEQALEAALQLQLTSSSSSNSPVTRQLSESENDNPNASILLHQRAKYLEELELAREEVHSIGERLERQQKAHTEELASLQANLLTRFRQEISEKEQVIEILTQEKEAKETEQSHIKAVSEGALRKYFCHLAVAFSTRRAILRSTQRDIFQAFHRWRNYSAWKFMEMRSIKYATITREVAEVSEAKQLRTTLAARLALMANFRQSKRWALKLAIGKWQAQVREACRRDYILVSFVTWRERYILKQALSRWKEEIMRAANLDSMDLVLELHHQSHQRDLYLRLSFQKWALLTARRAKMRKKLSKLAGTVARAILSNAVQEWSQVVSKSNMLSSLVRKSNRRQTHAAFSKWVGQSRQERELELEESVLRVSELMESRHKELTEGASKSFSTLKAILTLDQAAQRWSIRAKSFVFSTFLRDKCIDLTRSNQILMNAQRRFGNSCLKRRALLEWKLVNARRKALLMYCARKAFRKLRDEAWKRRACWKLTRQFIRKRTRESLHLWGRTTRQRAAVRSLLNLMWRRQCSVHFTKWARYALLEGKADVLNEMRVGIQELASLSAIRAFHSVFTTRGQLRCARAFSMLEQNCLRARWRARTAKNGALLLMKVMDRVEYRVKASCFSLWNHQSRTIPARLERLASVLELAYTRHFFHKLVGNAARSLHEELHATHLRVESEVRRAEGLLHDKVELSREIEVLRSTLDIRRASHATRLVRSSDFRLTLWCFSRWKQSVNKRRINNILQFSQSTRWRERSLLRSFFVWRSRAMCFQMEKMSGALRQAMLRFALRSRAVLLERRGRARLALRMWKTKAVTQKAAKLLSTLEQANWRNTQLRRAFSLWERSGKTLTEKKTLERKLRKLDSYSGKVMEQCVELKSILVRFCVYTMHAHLSKHLFVTMSRAFVHWQGWAFQVDVIGTRMDASVAASSMSSRSSSSSTKHSWFDSEAENRVQLSLPHLQSVSSSYSAHLVSSATSPIHRGVDSGVGTSPRQSMVASSTSPLHRAVDSGVGTSPRRSMVASSTSPLHRAVDSGVGTSPRRSMVASSTSPLHRAVDSGVGTSPRRSMVASSTSPLHRAVDSGVGTSPRRSMVASATSPLHRAVDSGVGTSPRQSMVASSTSPLHRAVDSGVGTSPRQSMVASSTSPLHRAVDSGVGTSPRRSMVASATSPVLQQADFATSPLHQWKSDSGTSLLHRMVESGVGTSPRPPTVMTASGSSPVFSRRESATSPILMGQDDDELESIALSPVFKRVSSATSPTDFATHGASVGTSRTREIATSPGFQGITTETDTWGHSSKSSTYRPHMDSTTSDSLESRQHSDAIHIPRSPVIGLNASAAYIGKVRADILESSDPPREGSPRLQRSAKRHFETERHKLSQQALLLEETAEELERQAYELEQQRYGLHVALLEMESQQKKIEHARDLEDELEWTKRELQHARMDHLKFLIAQFRSQVFSNVSLEKLVEKISDPDDVKRLSATLLSRNSHASSSIAESETEEETDDEEYEEGLFAEQLAQLTRQRR